MVGGHGRSYHPGFSSPWVPWDLPDHFLAWEYRLRATCGPVLTILPVLAGELRTKKGFMTRYDLSTQS